MLHTIFGVLGAVAVATHLAFFALTTAPLWFLAGQISGTVAAITMIAGVAGLYGSSRIVPLSVTKNILLGGKISMSFFSGMLESFYQPMLEKARQERIPILDLPNTFNPYDPLYTCGIEPNEKGGALIAEGVHHIVTQHDFSGESKLYSKPIGSSHFVRKVNRNPSDWQVAYASQN